MTTPTTPRASRKRPLGTLSLAPDTWSRLDELAVRWRTTRSGAIERLVWESEPSSKAVERKKPRDPAKDPGA